jgi:hypothetical protein
VSLETAFRLNRHNRRKCAAVGEPSDIASDKLNGVGEISEFINEPERRTYYLLAKKLIPAGKLGSIWIGSKRVLRAHYAQLTGAE